MDRNPRPLGQRLKAPMQDLQQNPCLGGKVLGGGLLIEGDILTKKLSTR
jgi:hypothetical protein